MEEVATTVFVCGGACFGEWRRERMLTITSALPEAINGTHIIDRDCVRAVAFVPVGCRVLGGENNVEEEGQHVEVAVEIVEWHVISGIGNVASVSMARSEVR